MWYAPYMQHLIPDFNFGCWITPPSIYILNFNTFIKKNNTIFYFQLAICSETNAGPTSAVSISYLSNFQRFANDSWGRAKRSEFQCWPNVGIRLVKGCWLINPLPTTHEQFWEMPICVVFNPMLQCKFVKYKLDFSFISYYV